VAYRYLGYDPEQGWLAGATGAHLAWIGKAPRRAPVTVIPADLCGGSRPVTPAYGAFEDFSACRGATANR
jgi:hypothetical protein